MKPLAKLQAALRRLPCLLLDRHPVAPPPPWNDWQFWGNQTTDVRPRCPRCGRVLIPAFYGPGWTGLPDYITQETRHG